MGIFVIMKFIPEIFNRNISDDELIADIRRAAKRMRGKLLTLRQYGRLGKYAKNTVINRFGSWNDALRIAGLESAKPYAKRSRRTLMIEDIKRAAKLLGKECLSQTEYNNMYNGKSYRRSRAKFTSFMVTREFGSWGSAVQLAGLKSARSPIAARELLEEIKRVWIAAGRQPRRTDFRKHSVYSSSTYIRRYGTWLGAIAAFLRYIKTGIADGETCSAKLKPKAKVSPRKKRRVGLGIRLYVLERDRFRCCYCGRSPATHNVTLHIDHRKPVSRSGSNNSENLQTLCNECNLGKSNRIIIVDS
jgi:hypothetical protein